MWKSVKMRQRMNGTASVPFQCLVLEFKRKTAY